MGKWWYFVFFTAVESFMYLFYVPWKFYVPLCCLFSMSLSVIYRIQLLIGSDFDNWWILCSVDVLLSPARRLTHCRFLFNCLVNVGTVYWPICCFADICIREWVTRRPLGTWLNTGRHLIQRDSKRPPIPLPPLVVSFCNLYIYIWTVYWPVSKWVSDKKTNLPVRSSRSNLSTSPLRCGLTVEQSAGYTVTKHSGSSGEWLSGLSK